MRTVEDKPHTACHPLVFFQGECVHASQRRGGIRLADWRIPGPWPQTEHISPRGLSDSACIVLTAPSLRRNIYIYIYIYTYIYIHTCMHACMHACMHNTHSLSLSLFLSFFLSLSLALPCIVHSCMPTYEHTDIQAEGCVCVCVNG